MITNVYLRVLLLQIYAGYCGKVSQIDPATGKVRWRTKMQSTSIAFIGKYVLFSRVLFVARCRSAGHRMT